MTLRICIVVLYFLALTPVAESQVLTSRDLLEQQDRWSDWATEKHKILVTGRYAGRSDSRLRLQKLKIVFVPERGIEIPDRLGIATPLSVSGYFVEGGDKPRFRVTSLTIEPTDRYRLSQRLQKISDSDPEACYQLANQYELLAQFYSDQQLQSDVEHSRISTFDAQRKRHRNEAKALWSLVDPGPGFDVAEEVQQHIRFEVFCVRAASKSGATVMKELKKYLPGWQTPAPAVPAALQAAFENDRVMVYGKADVVERRQLERLLYRQIRLKELQSQFKPDGSNGLTVAASVANDLPEETTAIRHLESTWANYRLRDIQKLKRRQLDEGIVLLRRIERQDDASEAANKWLRHQESDSRNQGSDGLLRLADDFLHASTKWRLPGQRSQGIQYLKRAWTSASKNSPQLALEIEQRLVQLGFARLNNRWMTSGESENLPQNDIERAKKKQGIDRGMSSSQVETLLGVPTRRIRMASSTYVEDLWVYGDRRGSRFLVRLRRPRTSPNHSAKVIEYLQISGL